MLKNVRSRINIVLVPIRPCQTRVGFTLYLGLGQPPINIYHFRTENKERAKHAMVWVHMYSFFELKHHFWTFWALNCNRMHIKWFPTNVLHANVGQNGFEVVFGGVLWKCVFSRILSNFSCHLSIFVSWIHISWKNRCLNMRILPTQIFPQHCSDQVLLLNVKRSLTVLITHFFRHWLFVYT